MQCDGEDKGYIYAGWIAFGYSKFWFMDETYTAVGSIYTYYFACKTLENLKKVIRWILKDTTFEEATALVKSGSYVTFRRADDLDREFRYYYGG